MQGRASLGDTITTGPSLALSYTKLQSCHCEERSDAASYHVEIASHSFAMASIKRTYLNASRYKYPHVIEACGRMLSEFHQATV
jgi:hypothetical protein